MKFTLPLAVLSLFAATLVNAHTDVQTDAPATQPERPLPAVEHVMIVSIDGMRPDRLLLANTPVLRGLISQGAYTFWAKTTAVSITLPSHVSMLTGVIPQKHGIEWNRDLPFSEPVYPQVPTIFELATKAGYSTALIAGKAKFEAICRPGSVKWLYASRNAQGSNDEVVENAVKIIEQHKPDLLFVHFPEVDNSGHKYGWGSAEQFQKIEKTDRQLGEVLAALDRAGIRKSTFIIVSADHGGAGLTHGADDARSRHIPWIATGPGVRQNYDLTSLVELEVRTEDTFATSAYLLGLPRGTYLDGQPVKAAFEKLP